MGKFDIEAYAFILQLYSVCGDECLYFPGFFLTFVTHTKKKVKVFHIKASYAALWCSWGGIPHVFQVCPLHLLHDMKMFWPSQDFFKGIFATEMQRNWTLWLYFSPTLAHCSPFLFRRP